MYRIPETGTQLAILECGADEERCMARAWLPGDPGDDELEQLFTADREAWRGPSPDDAEPWSAMPHSEDWRGEEHLADWPEEFAGPEYRLFKKWGDRR
ncbi:MAG: hypothetical protein DMD73_01020 [Gemmatimonadetes bacterium]|nr:MAG: hypothetical protein DMD73_01020 [Gemmatimonadota bacterium]